MNEFDQWVKHKLKQRYYLRYTDDFVILGESQAELEALIPQIAQFLAERLRLSLHPNKVTIRKLSQGIDFLGYVVRPHHTVLRTRTKKRMLRRIEKKNLSSYLGLLQHCRGHLLAVEIQRLVPPKGD